MQNLSRCFDLYLQDSLHWDVIDPLPSYGRGLELPGKRYRSLISGQNLTDVVVTGERIFTIDIVTFDFLVPFFPTCCSLKVLILALTLAGNNGTIDGQGSVWWEQVNNHSLNYSRPHLVEFISSENIVISNLTFLNAPAWNIHPVYCR